MIHLDVHGFSWGLAYWLLVVALGVVFEADNLRHAWRQVRSVRAGDPDWRSLGASTLGHLALHLVITVGLVVSGVPAALVQVAAIRSPQSLNFTNAPSAVAVIGVVLGLASGPTAAAAAAWAWRWNTMRVDRQVRTAAALAEAKEVPVPEETAGEVVHVETADHPPRTDSPEYKATHRWLMSQVAGGCFVCGGPVDLGHPDAPADARGLKLEDHHGGGITLRGVLVALNLFPLEWSQGWGADPVVVARFVDQLNAALRELGEPAYDEPITTVAEVMAYTDSRYNASLKLCAVHHRATQTQHTPDANGHEGVGIHEIPAPIWFGQVTCAWATFDMWGGSTGTIAVSPHPWRAGHTIVQHIHPSHPVRADDGSPLRVGHVLPPTHPHSRAAHRGYGSASTASPAGAE